MKKPYHAQNSRTKGENAIGWCLVGGQGSSRVEVRSIAPQRWRGQPRHYNQGPGSLVGQLIQIVVANKLMKPTIGAKEGSSEVRSKRREEPPRGDKKEKQVEFDTETKIQSDSRYLASGKRMVSPSQAHSESDLRESLNAKRNRDRDLQAQFL